VVIGLSGTQPLLGIVYELWLEKSWIWISDRIIRPAGAFSTPTSRPSRQIIGFKARFTGVATSGVSYCARCGVCYSPSSGPVRGTLPNCEGTVNRQYRHRCASVMGVFRPTAVFLPSARRVHDWAGNKLALSTWPSPSPDCQKTLGGANVRFAASLQLRFHRKAASIECWIRRISSGPAKGSLNWRGNDPFCEL